MKKILKQLKRENGQVFPLALIILALGSILVTSLLTSVTTSMTNVDVYAQAEHKVDIVQGAVDYLTKLIDTANYTVDDMPDTLTLNGVTAHFTVVENTSASSDFSGAMFNDTQNFTNWVEDKVSLTEDPPESGDYYASIIKHSYLQFMVDLDSYDDLVLKIHAYINFYRDPDLMVCRLSKDGENWTPIYIWNVNDNTPDYQYYDIDLTPYNLTGPFWISFDSQIVWGNADFNVDEIKISSGYTIVVTITQ